MAILTSSTSSSSPTPTKTSLTIGQSDLVHRNALISGSTTIRYSDTLKSAIRVFARRYLQTNRIALAYSLFGCQVAALHTLLVTKDLATMSVAALSQAAWGAWNSKQCRRLRKKLEFEFWVLILGSGNGVMLIVFWPGWILIGLAYLVYLLCGWAG